MRLVSPYSSASGCIRSLMFKPYFPRYKTECFREFCFHRAVSEGYYRPT